MPQFYFRQHVNGRPLAKDHRGRAFGSVAEARTYALCCTPDLLRKNLRSAAKDTYLSTEISDGERTVYVVRMKVISEKR
jgi:hypothetical protein